MKRPPLVLVAVAGLLLVPTPSLAQGRVGPNRMSRPFAGWVIVPLVNGPNQVDLDGDGRPDEVIVARRENGNAHDFSVFTFLAHSVSAYSDTVQWNLLPFFDGRGQELDALATTEGADCLLGTVWLVRESGRAGNALGVLDGDREVGESYAAPAPVRFTLYRLFVNDSGAIGSPRLSFRVQRTFRAPKPYCDVRNAAAALGLTAASDSDTAQLESSDTSP